MESDTTYNASRVLRPIWIASKCHQTTHLLFCRATAKWPQNERKSYSYSRSKPWKTIIYHPMSPRGIPRHSVHGSRGRLKAWTFNFYRFRAHSGLFLFFAQNLPMGSDTTYNASRVFRAIWISSECHQTTHFLFCRATTKSPQNGRKSFSYSCSKPCENSIYHPMSPRDIPQHCTGPEDVRKRDL